MAVTTRFASASLLLLAAATGCDGCGDSGTDGSGGGGAGLTTGPGGTQGTSNGGSSGTDADVSAVVSVGSTGCTAITCESAGAECGEISDGCNGSVSCGSCEDGLTCMGVPPTCEQGGPCTPDTCEEAGAECGRAVDGCGGLTESCGSCTQPEKCGGDGPPAEVNQCSIPASCTGLCLDQVTCPDPAVTTTFSGIIRAPGRVGFPGDPLYDALVYIPNGPVDAFTTGVVCSQCGEEASGDPIVSARTDYQGRFVLENVPVAAGMKLVIQLGRWRRIVDLPAPTECADVQLDAELTRLPRNKTEGDIPLIAVATGNVDGLECVLRKIGIEDSEFTNPGGGGRVHLYQGEGAGGMRINQQTPSETVLLDNPGTLDDYDMVLFPCQGASFTDRATPTRKNNLRAYTDAGGRVFATHYSYDWLHDNGNWSTVADWDVGVASFGDGQLNGEINTSFPKGQIFADWLLNVGASTVLGIMPVVVVRQNVDAVVDPLATQWMTTFGDDGNVGNNIEVPLHLTFNTPIDVPAEDQCGRALFSDFHITNDSGLEDTTFPNGCDGAQAADQPMTPQEKLVEFMLFDLGACLTPDVPMCEPVTCEILGFECGLALDGCDGEIDCGECPPGETCGGGGEPGICGNNQCVPETCEDLGKNCGMVGNGCGQLQDCGECTGTQTCGGGGTPNVCGGGIPG